MSDRTPTSAPERPATPRGEFVAGARSMVPFLLSAFPLGVIGGTLGLASGLSYLETFGLAMVVNSGTAQFIGFKLIAEGAAWPVIVLTTLILSLRMLIYSTLLAADVARCEVEVGDAVLRTVGGACRAHRVTAVCG
ncbi:AzlC family ABC transporter permease, partial [Micromonospora sp. DH15]|nr:AzlC family ABC transporter permease [Micromonospora sp. DH15]